MYTEGMVTLLMQTCQQQIILQDGFSSLMFAASKGHLETVKMLLKSQAPVNYKNVSSSSYSSS